MRSFAGKYRYPLDANREMIGLGMSNGGAGLFQSFAVGVSLSRSAANDSAGARSQVSGLVAAGHHHCRGALSDPALHQPARSDAGRHCGGGSRPHVQMAVDRHLYRVRRFDFALTMVALLGVLTFQEVLTGLLVAVIVSLSALVWRAGPARVSVLGRRAGAFDIRQFETHPETLPVPGLLIVRPDEGLFFANAAPLREQSSVDDGIRPAPQRGSDRPGDDQRPGRPNAHELAELHTDLDEPEFTLCWRGCTLRARRARSRQRRDRADRRREPAHACAGGCGGAPEADGRHRQQRPGHVEPTACSAWWKWSAARSRRRRARIGSVWNPSTGACWMQSRPSMVPCGSPEKVIIHAIEHPKRS